MSERGDVTTLPMIERQAVELGIMDADSGWMVSAPAEGLRAKHAQLTRVVTGQRGHQPLANPRLELVRTFAALTHCQHRPADRLIPALQQQGYEPSQIAAFTALAA